MFRKNKKGEKDEGWKDMYNKMGVDTKSHE